MHTKLCYYENFTYKHFKQLLYFSMKKNCTNNAFYKNWFPNNYDIYAVYFCTIHQLWHYQIVAQLFFFKMQTKSYLCTTYIISLLLLYSLINTVWPTAMVLCCVQFVLRFDKIMTFTKNHELHTMATIKSTDYFIKPKNQ